MAHLTIGHVTAELDERKFMVREKTGKSLTLTFPMRPQQGRQAYIAFDPTTNTVKQINYVVLDNFGPTLIRTAQVFGVQKDYTNLAMLIRHCYNYMVLYETLVIDYGFFSACYENLSDTEKEELSPLISFSKNQDVCFDHFYAKPVEEGKHELAYYGDWPTNAAVPKHIREGTKTKASQLLITSMFKKVSFCTGAVQFNTNVENEGMGKLWLVQLPNFKDKQFDKIFVKFDVKRDWMFAWEMKRVAKQVFIDA